ncbi:acetate--CoA ligase [Dissulfurispira thermophila]|uniref:Acetate--CoA ligase n=1 Tax=Dissulfurispira thermophila TaxID=2715679 RepID=A0A7G1H0I1_9BACT|nr:CoA-binding protein [Dissulfurispira thermophila]BCB95789.1 acetate--CoA ligase [Dissulfurispira thermophila]
MSLDCLFNPESIALVGAAHSEEKLGGVILKNLLKFRGRVYPVNPNYTELMGLKTYPSAKDISESIDLTIIIRPASEVPEILKELQDKTKCVIIASSGFAEIGQKKLQDEVKKIGKEIGVRILGPNCMGLYNPYQRLDTFFLPYERLRRPKKGNASVVSQSGAILSCLLAALRKANTGISKAIGYGNAIDIDESDIYEYLCEDKDTQVVISYIESVGDGRKFIEKAKMVSEKKPFIILKAGKGLSGEKAAFSHTGRLAGKYEIFHSIIKQFGIKEAMDFDELIDAAKALSYQRPSKGSRVCIITNGGGSGVLSADECMRYGLDVAKLPDDKAERLGHLFPYFYGINNPIDLTAQVRDEDYITALNELKDDYDGFIIIALPNVMGITKRLPEMIKNAITDMNKPVVFHIPVNGVAKRLISHLEKMKIPVYPSPERAVRGLKALLMF